jgi:putative tryptophan/tyrosine transport system substrate-binding protein
MFRPYYSAIYVLVAVFVAMCFAPDEWFNKPVGSFVESAGSFVESEDAGTKTAVALFSYHPGFWVVEDENKGLIKGLEEFGYVEGQNIVMHRFYMDTKRANKTVEAQEGAADELLNKVQGINPDILFIFDDDALRHIGGKLLDTNLPIVFAGVNLLPTRPDYAWKNDGSFTALADSLEKPGHNVTGVQEKVHFSAGFQLLHRIVPKATTALFLSDNSLIGTELIRTAGGEGALDNPFITIMKRAYTDSFETLKKLILDYQDKVDSIVLFIPWTLEDKEGNHVPQEQVVRWMLQNSKRPGIAYLDVLAEEGYLCGMVVDMIEQGKYAGFLGSRILKGEHPAEMPVLDPVANRIIINLARARQLGIDIPFEIFEDADVIFKEMTVYPEFTAKK